MASVRKRAWKSASGETKAAWVVDYTDSRGERQRKHFANKKKADTFRIQVESQMQAGTYRPDADRVSVKELCSSFAEYCKGRNQRDERMTRKMLAVYQGHINNYILHPDYGLGSRKLSQLTARSVSDFRDRLRNSGVTVPTTRKILATLPRRPRVCDIPRLGRDERRAPDQGPRSTQRRFEENYLPSKADMRLVLNAALKTGGSRSSSPHLQVREQGSMGRFVAVTWIWEVAH